MEYKVINMTTGEKWKGIAENAKEAYSHIKIKKGDTTVLWKRKRIISVKEW